MTRVPALWPSGPGFSARDRWSRFQSLEATDARSTSEAVPERGGRIHQGSRAVRILGSGVSQRPPSSGGLHSSLGGPARVTFGPASNGFFYSTCGSRRALEFGEHGRTEAAPFRARGSSITCMRRADLALRRAPFPLFSPRKLGGTRAPETCVVLRSGGSSGQQRRGLGAPESVS
mgnify:FL=1